MQEKDGPDDDGTSEQQDIFLQGTKELAHFELTFDDCLVFQGCSAPLTEFVEQHLMYLIAVGGGLLAVHILGILLSLCLCCFIKPKSEFKV